MAVHTGEVLARPGAEHEGVVTGETTTIAARLQTIAPTGGVVVGERTFRDTERVFEFALLGRKELKGLPRPVTAWQALREREDVHALATPLVGRRDELELLGLLLRRCAKEARPYVATIIGAASIGKSQLARELAEAAARGAVAGAERCAVVRGRGEAREQAEGALLPRLLVGRVEVAAWELAADADGLRDSGGRLLRSAEGESPPHEALARNAVARADHLAGEWATARDGAKVALGVAKLAEDLPATWRACSIADTASRALGEAGEARGLRRRSSEILRAMLSSLDDRELRRAFAGRADVAAVLDGEEP